VDRKKTKKEKSLTEKYHENKNWDTEIPPKEYFNELFRVSKNQIIWGANYFVTYLNSGTKGWIVWDKGQHGLTMSDCELAYSSFNVATRIFTQNRVILLQEGGTIHPTQKPVKLYKWLLMNYAKEGDKILDTHLGSGSIAIACHNLGFDLTACELDKDYFEAAMKRLKQHQAQLTMF
jgi:site-specific DNA-methyltransferase (adenine-specific)